MRDGSLWFIAAAAVVVVLAAGWGIRLAVTADPGRRVRAREAAAAVAQYGLLFEFSLRETRHTARGAERTLTGPGWLHPAERLRVRALLSADAKLSVGVATRWVRVTCAARRLYALRQVLEAEVRVAKLGIIAA